MATFPRKRLSVDIPPDLSSDLFEDEGVDDEDEDEAARE
jgi:hypothetical protein